VTELPSGILNDNDDECDTEKRRCAYTMEQCILGIRHFGHVGTAWYKQRTGLSTVGHESSLSTTTTFSLTGDDGF
jgi:hypothetical protein